MQMNYIMNNQIPSAVSLLLLLFASVILATAKNESKFHCTMFPTLPGCCEASDQPCLFAKGPTISRAQPKAGDSTPWVRKARQQNPNRFRNMAEYCKTYRQNYLDQCDGFKGKETTTQWMKFCSAYAVACEQDGGCAGCEELSSVVQPPSPMDPQGEWGAFDPRSTDFCRAFTMAAEQKCKGFETGRLGDLCKAFNQRCRSTTAASATPGWPMFSGNNLMVQQLCEKYKFIFRANCPGYEIQQVRPYCNTYRVYCLGEKPKIIIDGSVGVSRNVWGVGGIPYYPFNPEGLIAGGTKHNVGFGDWGASWTRTRGVSDFWQGYRGVDANWHAGRFGYTRGFEVPLVGVSGMTRTGVGIGSGGLLQGVLGGGAGSPIAAFSNELYKAGVIAHMPTG